MGVWWYTWRPEWCEIGGTLGGFGWASVEMHLEAIIGQDRRCYWRPSSSEIRGVLAGAQSGGSHLGGRCDGSWDSNQWSVRDCWNVENRIQLSLWRDQRLAGRGTQSIFGWYSTWWMQYSVYAALGVCCTWCQLLNMAWRDSDGWLNFVFIGDGRVEEENEIDQRIHDK